MQLLAFTNSAAYADSWALNYMPLITDVNVAKSIGDFNFLNLSVRCVNWKKNANCVNLFKQLPHFYRFLEYANQLMHFAVHSSNLQISIAFGHSLCSLYASNEWPLFIRILRCIEQLTAYFTYSKGIWL